MLREPLVGLHCQTRTFSPRLTSILAQAVEKFAGKIAKKHSDSTTQSDQAITDLQELRNVESDLEQSRQTLTDERKAVSAAIGILTGEDVAYYGDHQLVRHAENLITQSMAVKMVDADLSAVDHDGEIGLLTQLQAELNDALTTANNRIDKAFRATRTARGHAVCRCSNVRAAIQNLPGQIPLPSHREWNKVDPSDAKTLVNRCRLAVKDDQLSFKVKRKKLNKEIASKQLATLKMNN